jgi:hypothetical protein
MDIENVEQILGDKGSDMDFEDSDDSTDVNIDKLNEDIDNDIKDNGSDKISTTRWVWPNHYNIQVTFK